MANVKSNEKEQEQVREMGQSVGTGTAQDNGFIEEEATSSGLIVEREKFISKETRREYWAYLVRGEVRGKKIKADLSAKDSGGYEVLDLVYGIEKALPLMVIPFRMKDPITGKVSKGNTYAVSSIDADGVVLTSKVVPSRESDKSLLEMLLNVAKVQAQKA